MKDSVIFSISVLVLIVTCGVYLFLFSGVIQGVERISIAALDAETLERRDNLARTISEILGGVVEEQDTLNGFVVKDAEVVSVIELLEDIAREQNILLSISGVSVAADTAWKHHEYVEVAFSVDGTFTNITNLIATLEALPLATSVKNGGLEVGGSGNWFGSFTLHVLKEKI